MLLVIASMLPLIVFAAVMALFDHRRERDEARQQMQNISRALVQALDRDIETHLAVLRVLATHPSLQTGDFATLDERFRQVLTALPKDSALLLSDATGQQLVNTFQARGEPLARRLNMRLIEHVFGLGDPTISDVFVGSVSNRPIISLDVPVFIDGKVAYDLAMGMPVEEFQKVLRVQRLPKGWLAAIIDRTGTLIARVPEPEKFVGTKAAPQLIKGAAEHPEGTVEGPSVDGSMVQSTWSRSTFSGWTVAVAQPDAEYVAPLARNLAAVVGGGLILVLIGLVGALRIARPIAAAMASLRDSAIAVGRGREPSVTKAGVQEVEEIGLALVDASRLLQRRAGELEASMERQKLIMAELDHRVRNTLALVQSIMRLAAKSGDSKEAFSDAVHGRIDAMARAHGLLTQSQWRGASLRQLVADELGPFSAGDAARLRVAGEDLLLQPRAVVLLALVIHELATNAAKYGALSTPHGRLSVSWSIGRESEDPRLVIRWTESGGPGVVPPSRRGFGSILLEKTLTQEFDAEVRLEFQYKGVRYTAAIPLARISADIREPSAPEGRDLVAMVGSRDLSGMRILLVEDDSLIGLDMKEGLDAAGVTVIGPVGRLDRALAMANESQLDAAVLDVNLGGVQAFPVADVLAKRGIPFAFLTGYQKDAVFPDRYRQTPSLQKPVSRRALAGMIERLAESGLGNHGEIDGGQDVSKPFGDGRRSESLSSTEA